VPRLIKRRRVRPSRDRITEGELGFFIVSDGKSTKPVPVPRAPAVVFCNLQGLRRLVKGHLVADVVALIGSIDIVLGEVDR